MRIQLDNEQQSDWGRSIVLFVVVLCASLAVPTVANAQAPRPGGSRPETYIHIHSIDTDIVETTDFWLFRLDIQVTVHNQYGMPVAGVLVEGQSGMGEWLGFLEYTLISGDTDANGVAVFQSPLLDYRDWDQRRLWEVQVEDLTKSLAIYSVDDNEVPVINGTAVLLYHPDFPERFLKLARFTAFSGWELYSDHYSFFQEFEIETNTGRLLDGIFVTGTCELPLWVGGIDRYFVYANTIDGRVTIECEGDYNIHRPGEHVVGLLDAEYPPLEYRWFFQEIATAMDIGDWEQPPPDLPQW